jgi:hypothetical protein
LRSVRIGGSARDQPFARRLLPGIARREPKVTRTSRRQPPAGTSSVIAVTPPRSGSPISICSNALLPAGAIAIASTLSWLALTTSK